MGQTNIVDNSKTVNQSIKQIENEVKVSVKNMNVDLSSLNLSGAIESFRQLNKVLEEASFERFIENITNLQESFAAFQTKVAGAQRSVTNFAKNVPDFGGGIVAANVAIDTAGAADEVAGVEQSIAGAAGSISGAAGSIAGSIGSAAGSVSGAAGSIAGSISTAGSAISDVTNAAAGFFLSLAAVNNSLSAAAVGISALIPLLPALGTALLAMAVNMAGLTAYLPELLIFLGIVTALGLLGEGLALAGQGLLNIGLGLTAMTAGMAALLEFFPAFIECLAGTQLNIGGIILFVLLAAAMVAMAVAMQLMNEQFAAFVGSLEKMHSLMSVGFVAAFVVFGLMMIAMSLFLDKVANGIDKITKAMDKQILKLAILNPLLAAQAILSNPITGAITVALAIAGGLLVRALIPAMATGGVVSGPTMALVGEGRYPEAVVPLGNSPQFSVMKNDIASAVLAGLSAAGGMSRSGGGSVGEVILAVDGAKLARIMIPAIEKEYKRKGMVTQIRSV